MTIEAHDLQHAITDEYTSWRMLRAHLPDCDPDTVDISGLDCEQLAVVESYLGAREARRQLLRPVVPPQSPGTPTPPGVQPIQ